MNKQDEEKARELANEYKNYTHLNAIHLHLEGKSKEEVVEQCVYAAALEMAAWKDKQFSNRVEMTLCIDCHEFESCDNCPKYKLKKELLAL